MEQGLLLLDTHTWIWLMNGEEPLKSSPARQQIEQAVGPDRMRVSVISVWEVGLLVPKNRISLSMGCDEWVRQALSAPGVSLAPLTPEIALASSHLPGEFHGDPADRIIVATARQIRATLVTRDSQIIQYGDQGHVGVLAV